MVYLGHIPFGFFEKQMRGFFEQFGDISNLRLARSIKTTNSKGYAFIEFKDKEVAEIVAETMNNYILYGRVLKAEVMKPEKVHADMFKGAGRRMKRVPRAKLEALRLNASKSEEEVAKRVSSLKRSDSKKRKKLEAAGIEYEYPGYSGESGAATKKAKRTPAKKSKKAAAPTPGQKTPSKKKVTATPSKKKATATPSKKKVAATPSKKKVAATPKATPIRKNISSGVLSTTRPVCMHGR